MTEPTEDRYTAIMARTPEIVWTMPEQAPDVTALAGRDEILEARLRCAARIVWLRLSKSDETLEPGPVWIANEVQNLRDVLETGSQRRYSNDDVRVYVLKLLGISQSWKSSSKRAEQAAE